MWNRQILFIIMLVGCTKPQAAPTADASASAPPPPPTPPIEAGVPAPTVSLAATPDASAKKSGEPCGKVTCPPNQYCCNPVMSICANPGEMCAQ